jgi:hypothetical protein
MMREAGFMAALLDPEMAVPAGLVDARGQPAGRRFSVYRNNVAGSLTDVLAAGFPALEKLLGAEYFRALAGVFLRAHPPQTRMMMLYGADMPVFLAGFAPLAHLPYMADVARLEQALRESYHAADAAAHDLSALGPEPFMAARLVLAPGVRLLRAPHPVLSIWRANMEGGPAPRMQAEDVLIVRPEFDPVAHVLPTGGAAFVAALLAGDSVGAAFEAAGDGFDVNVVLGLLVGGGAIVGLKEDL